MLKSADGERLFRKVTIRVIFPDDVLPPKVFTQHAPAHRGFTADAVDEMLMNLASRLEELHPYWEFKPVELTPEGRTARYVFTFAGYRPVKQIPNTDDVVASGPEAAVIDPSTVATPESAISLLREQA